MAARSHHLAQVNIARLLAPLDTPQLADFVAALDPVNAMAEAYVCLWWIPAGHIPTVDEAKERLEHLRRQGPTPYAFTFRQSFAADMGQNQVEQPEDDRWLCPSP